MNILPNTIIIINQLSSLASLFHDIGKAANEAQDRILKTPKNGNYERNLYRHEWISLRLFQSFVHNMNDEEWIQKFINFKECDIKELVNIVLLYLMKDGITEIQNPFKVLSPIAKVVGWLILTHHRMPAKPIVKNDKEYWSYGYNDKGINKGELGVFLNNITANWNEPHKNRDKEKILNYWKFDKGLPVTKMWCLEVSKCAEKLQDFQYEEWMNNPFIMNLSRMCLMLADHYYSSLGINDDKRKSFINKKEKCKLYANSYIDKNGNKKSKQSLDEHLLGVSYYTKIAVNELPTFKNNLSFLENSEELANDTKIEKFIWQNSATKMARSLSNDSEKFGAFIVNMASTGCGKTLGNARIMYGLANNKLRCVFAIGLRVLTLQTGRDFKNKLNLTDGELSIMTGGLFKDLFEYYENSTGSESIEELLDETIDVLSNNKNKLDNPILNQLNNKKIDDLITTPLLTCTIDHLIQATEGIRGGRQIAPMLRLLSSDLVLDEPDDFDINDLPALTRLVNWAGMLGSRVLISSATLNSSLIEGIFCSYKSGRQWFNKACGNNEEKICCMWVDEFNQVNNSCENVEDFNNQHFNFVKNRYDILSKQSYKRIGTLLSTDEISNRSKLAEVLWDSSIRLHNDHHDTIDGKNISFGLIRIANINPLVDIARELFELKIENNNDTHIHLCVYHSQFPAYIRSAIENKLDKTLNRHDEGSVYKLDNIKNCLEKHKVQNHIFIVIGSPVTEVGRDHDYDWAIVEPSSMKSIIQLGGRVLRHRNKDIKNPNILILDKNIKAIENKEIAYTHPGFENKEFKLDSHDLNDLLEEIIDAEIFPIDSRTRIWYDSSNLIEPRKSLIKLEHKRTEVMMLPIDKINSSCQWECKHPWLSGLLQQRHPFRENLRDEIDVVMLPIDGDLQLHKFGNNNETLKISDQTLESIKLSSNNKNISEWGNDNYMELMEIQSKEMGYEIDNFAKLYSTCTLPYDKKKNKKQWNFNQLLGFSQTF